MKIIAFYLPQFYTFKENDEWWGKGFTEWTNVRKSVPLYNGHYQPTIPLNNNYYDLKNKETFIWQTELAKKYGIYGFCFYHYWMGENRKLMHEALEMYLSEKEIDFPYCLCWANHNWARTWTGGDKDVLMDVRYGKKDEWENHFLYLLEFFKDKRYIKRDNKPLLVIYLPDLIPNRNEMLEYFNKRSVEEGFDGLAIYSQEASYALNMDENEKYITGAICYEPNYTRFLYSNASLLKKIKLSCISPQYTINRFCHILQHIMYKVTNANKYKLDNISYDGIWKLILKRDLSDDRLIPGAFVNVDTTPRKGYGGLYMEGYTVEKFSKNLKEYMYKIKHKYKKDMLFIMAWNEWGEGAYLEPDEKDRYGALEAIKEALDNINEY